MWTFLKESFKHFITQGSLIPSSSYLTRLMLKPVLMKPKVLIVELGAGSGAFTRELIKRLPPDGRLIVFEFNHTLAEHVRRTIVDSRVRIIEDSALYLKDHLRRLDIDTVDYIISGLPIGNFSSETQQAILNGIHDTLAPDGVYVQFQYFLATWFRVRSLFKAKIVGYELRNFPPAFVYVCRRKY